MQLDALKEFSLVGGTALSLLYGHRISVDLDIFSAEKFDNTIIEKTLLEAFGGSFTYEGIHPNFGIFCYINEVKVDIVHYPHKTITSPANIDGIRILDPSDIAAMKVQAILGRGKKKDFWDIHELLKHYTLSQIIEWHKEKFPNQMLPISIPQAITYFVDADDSEDPVSLKGQTWKQVQKAIQQKVSEFLK